MTKFSSNFLIAIFSIIALLFHSESIFAQPQVTSWSYIEIDNNKSKWGDYDKPDWLRYFGLDMGDLNGDGQNDILSGRWVYLNPGATMEDQWTKLDLGSNVDGILVMDVDGDEYDDIIAQSLPDIFWFESTDKEGTSWKSIKIGEVPATDHVNSQGFAKGQIIAGGKEEFVIAGNGNIYCFEIPKNPEKNKWKNTLIGTNTSDEGIGIGDIDGDGDLDLASGRIAEGAEEPQIIVWHKNPGDGSGNWESYEVGTTNHAADRLAVADLNGDGKSDIIVTEERFPGDEPDGNIFWYEQPEGSLEKWIRNRVVTQSSTNSLDVSDIDSDGDIDILTCEHKGPNPELQIWKNDGRGTFSKEILDRGKESHLGTQFADMDKDGDLDIISIGWDQHNFVRMWRNDEICGETRKWKLISSSKGELAVPNDGNEQTASLVMDVNKDGAMDFFIAERTKAPAVTLYIHTKDTWERYIVEDNPMHIEAGSASYDIDGDGDDDVVFGGDFASNEVWWWENPYPEFDPQVPWKRHIIKRSGENKHHDQMFGDFDGDGKQELVFWNQDDAKLILAEIPLNPKSDNEWEMKTIYQYSTDSEMMPLVGPNGYPGWQTPNEHEGLFKYDIDGDGIEDILGGGRWFKYVNGTFIPNIIDASYTFSRIIVGQLIEGGRAEVLIVVGDGKGPLNLYQWNKGTWIKTQLIEDIEDGHSLDLIDFNGDGHLDIFNAEMRFGEGNPDSKIRILLGDGEGHFKEMVVAKGYALHESRITDLDGDGDLDILGKPYEWNAPLLNIWINEGPKK